MCISWLSWYLILTDSWGLHRQIQALLLLHIPFPLQNRKPHGTAIILRISIISKLGRNSKIRTPQSWFLIFMWTENLENFLLSQPNLDFKCIKKIFSWQKRVEPLYFVFMYYLKFAKLHKSTGHSKMYASATFKNYQHFWYCLTYNSLFSSELF